MRYVVLCNIGTHNNWVRPEAERLSEARSEYRTYPTRGAAEKRALFLGGHPVFRACSEAEAAELVRLAGH